MGTKRQGFSVLLLVGAFLCVFGAAVNAATLHSVLVIDTNDKNIGRMVAVDLKLIEDEVRKISQATGLSVRTHLYKGSDFQLKKVGEAIRSIKVGSDDVIFFYYSGHGLRTKVKTSVWPYLFFHSKTPLDYGWVIQELKAKGARLTVTLTDACNNVATDRVPEVPAYTAKGLNKAGYRKLFLKARGFVVATSSKPGEFSTATGGGSLFTLSFLKALHNGVAQNGNASWKAVMKEGAGQKLYFRGEYKHTPVYQLNVAYGSGGGSSTGGNTGQASQPSGPVMACKAPSNVGAPRGKFDDMPYWTGQFFKGLHWGKAYAVSSLECHSACKSNTNCTSWLWFSRDKKCLFKHYCPKEGWTGQPGAVSGYSGNKPACKMGPGCGLKDAAQAAPQQAPQQQPQQQNQGGSWQAIF